MTACAVSVVAAPDLRRLGCPMAHDYLPESPLSAFRAPAPPPGIVETALCIVAYFAMQFVFGALFGGGPEASGGLRAPG